MTQSNVVSIVSVQRKTAIINRYAALASQLSALKAQLDQAKIEAIELLGEGTHETSSAKVTINWVARDVFDQAKAKSFLTAGQLAQCAKASTFYDVRVKNL